MYIYIGTILQARGYSGEIIVGDVIPNLPDITNPIKVKIGFSEQFSKDYTLIRAQKNQRNLFINLKEIKSDTIALTLKEQGVFIDENILKEFNENFVSDENLIGCKLFDFQNEEELGEIVEIWDTLANRVWVVSNGEREFHFPEVEEFIIGVDLIQRKILVRIIDGLIE